MAKRIALILVFSMLITLIAGCNASGPSQTPGGTGNEGLGDSNASSLDWPDATDNPSVTVHASEPPSGFSETATPDTLTVAQGGEPNTLYPLDGNQIPAIIAMRPMYETLLYYSPYTNAYEPRLAERWEQIDDETIRVYLRKGVYCHAGYEMTAEDVRWTVQMGQENPVSSFLWTVFDLDRFKIIDDYTIEMVTKGSYGPILYALSDPSVGYIVNKQAYEEQAPEDYARNPTGGTGPYKFVEWIAGDRIIYERYDNYWGDKPYYQNLVLRNIADDVTRALSLESGEVDLIYGVDAASYQTLIDSPTTNLVSLPSYQLIHFGMNNTVEPFNNPLVRKAMRHALDLDNMVNLAFNGLAEVADGCWPNSLSNYSPASEELSYEYNVEKARELLKEAGYENGFTFDLWCAETTAWVQMAEMIQNALGEIGITAKVQVMDQNMLIAQRETGEYQAYIARFSGTSDDTDEWYFRLYPGLGYGENVVQYENERVGELLDAARYSVDQEFRNECYAEVLTLWRQDLPWISLACPQMIYGIRSTLTGIEPHPYGVGDLRYIRPVDLG